MTGRPEEQRLQHPAIPTSEVQTIVDSPTPGLISSIGVSLFVYPYERYKRKLIAIGYDDFQQKATEVFTANAFNTQANSQAAFPNNIVRVWNAPAGNAAASLAADSIRKSFAHGQSTLTDVNGVQMLDM